MIGAEHRAADRQLRLQALFALVAAESLGVPLPGETTLIVAGTYAGTTHHLNPWLIFIVASAAAIIGDNIGFWIGDKGGYRLAHRYGSKVGFDERQLKIARYLFDRRGTLVVRREAGRLADRAEQAYPGPLEP